MKIGKNCLILNTHFSTEPYLIELGDHVAVSAGTHFVPHDGAVWVFRTENPELDVFGKIKIGNNTIIGIQCIILPNTVVGDNCIVGAGSVLRGKFPDNSVILGNPAKVVMRTQVLLKLIEMNKYKLNTKNMKRKDKDKLIKKHFNIS